MEKVIDRQMLLIRKFIEEYRAGILTLNKLILNIEGLSEIINVPEWKSAIFNIIVSMENVNTYSIYRHTDLTEADHNLIEESLCSLNKLIDEFRSGFTNSDE